MYYLINDEFVCKNISFTVDSQISFEDAYYTSKLRGKRSVKLIHISNVSKVIPISKETYESYTPKKEKIKLNDHIDVEIFEDSIRINILTEPLTKIQKDILEYNEKY